MKLESLVQYMDSYLEVDGFPDYGNALNGLQVAGPHEVAHVMTAVDASLASIEAAVDAGANLLVTHHGLFWSGLQPLTGSHFRRVAALVRGSVALYACHLPLDAHAEIGNCALLARALGLEPEGRIGSYQGAELGWWGELPEPLSPQGLVARLRVATGQDQVHLIPGGPDAIHRIGVVTGGGAGFVPEAAALGLDALVTGEGSHHSHFDGTENGIHVLFGGHYATETFGVRALGEHLAERFALRVDFLDQPTGL